MKKPGAGGLPSLPPVPTTSAPPPPPAAKSMPPAGRQATLLSLPPPPAVGRGVSPPPTTGVANEITPAILRDTRPLSAPPPGGRLLTPPPAPPETTRVGAGSLGRTLLGTGAPVAGVKLGLSLPPVPGARATSPLPAPPAKSDSAFPSAPPAASGARSSPRPAAPAYGGLPVDVDIDWDDDENEKTTLFGGPGSEPTPKKMGGLGGTRSYSPLPPIAPRSSPPPPEPRVRALASPSPGAYGAPGVAPRPRGSAPPSFEARPSTDEIEEIFPQRRRAPIVAAGALAVVLIGVLVLLFLPTAGTLVVAVAGPGNKQVDGIEVYVDGERKCDVSPCRVEELKQGVHTVRAKAAGYEETADKAVDVAEHTVIDVELTPSSQDTGLRVTAEGTGLKLTVDGKEVGLLPQQLEDITAGEHTIHVAGNARFAPHEQRVSVKEGQVTTIGPLKLKVVKGLALINPGNNSRGAKILLVSGQEIRPIPRLPIRLDIPTDRNYRVVASKTGFKAFEQPIEFEPGQVEKTFTVDLVPEDAREEQAVASAEPPAPSRQTSRKTSARPRSKTRAAPKPAGTTGTLTMNSVPTSTIVLDGQPRGTTPQVGVRVSAGPHTVMFVCEGRGRKVVHVNVPAGGKGTAIVRF